MTEREHKHFGDWRDLRGAIEAHDPKWNERPEAERKQLWDFATGVITNYQPLKVRCDNPRCGRVLFHWRVYRCADCKGAFCEDCIRPHFGPGHRAHA